MYDMDESLSESDSMRMYSLDGTKPATPEPLPFPSSLLRSPPPLPSRPSSSSSSSSPPAATAVAARTTAAGTPQSMTRSTSRLPMLCAPGLVITLSMLWATAWSAFEASDEPCLKYSGITARIRHPYVTTSAALTAVAASLRSIVGFWRYVMSISAAVGVSFAPEYAARCSGVRTLMATGMGRCAR